MTTASDKNRRDRWRRVGATAVTASLVSLALQVVVAVPSAFASPGDISTIAGNGSASYSGDGGPATAAALNGPTDAIEDPSGNTYIADGGNHVVRKIDPSGIITTFAGNGTDGNSGDGGPATQAQISQPFALLFDAGGNLLVSDANDNVIRRIDHTTGIITTIAGNGSFDNSGDGGPATQAALVPLFMAYDGGNLYVASYYDRIRKIDSSGTISTLISGINRINGLTADGHGNLYITEFSGNKVDKVDETTGVITVVAGTGQGGDTGDGGPATAAQLNAPYQVKLVGGELYISEWFNCDVRKVDKSGVITTIAGTGSCGYSGDGGPATAAQLQNPTGLTFNQAGDLLVADYSNNVIRRVEGVQPPDLLQLEGSSSPTPAVLGQPLTYTLTVTNPGTVGTATGVALTDQLPAGVTYNSATATQGTCSPSGTTVTCNLGLLPVLATVTVTITVTPTSSLLLTDTATVSANESDPLPANNTVTVLNGTAPAGLALNLPSFTGPQVPATFNLPATITNQGPNPATGVKLTVDIPATVTVKSTQTSQGSCTLASSTLTCAIGNLAVGATVTVTVTAAPTALAAATFSLAVTADQFNPLGGAGQTTIRFGCGATVTSSVTFSADLGPCAGYAIVVHADNITLNLNGHHVTGVGTAGGYSSDDGTAAGIYLAQRTGVTVENGTVSGFDTGVQIISGTSNTVTHMTLKDNIGPDSVTRGGSGGFDNLIGGEGIMVASSTANKILSNTVDHNGPFDGIGIVGVDANLNTVQGNTVQNTVADSTNQGGIGIAVNAFLFARDPQLPITANNVIANTVTNNAGAGISLLSDYQATVKANHVTGNGANPVAAPGILIGFLGGYSNKTQDKVVSNRVSNSGTDGIVVSSIGNTIKTNVATGDNLVGGTFYDLHDTYIVNGSPSCATDKWSGNTSGSAGFFPACT